MEYVVDEAAFTREYMTQPIQIVDGEIVLPEGPGWGSDINEEAVRARPAKS
jgi:L-alanine-DL-glutamate epimerase-like enolase superfamily enzyme